MAGKTNVELTPIVVAPVVKHDGLVAVLPSQAMGDVLESCRMERMKKLDALFPEWMRTVNTKFDALLLMRGADMQAAVRAGANKFASSFTLPISALSAAVLEHAIDLRTHRYDAAICHNIQRRHKFRSVEMAEHQTADTSGSGCWVSRCGLTVCTPWYLAYEIHIYF